MYYGNLRDFSSATQTHAGHNDRMALSVQVTSDGCFGRECGHACCTYAVVDRYLDTLPPANREFEFHEHESGPEILVWVLLSTAGLQLTKTVVELITTIIKARFDAAKKHEEHGSDLALVVRRFDGEGVLREEVALRVELDDSVSEEIVQMALQRGVEALLDGPASQVKTDD